MMTPKLTPVLPRISSSYKIYFFLILGLSTAIAFRSLVIIDHLHPELVRATWYFAVLGNFLFFCYRYTITRKRKSAIKDYALIDKVEQISHLEPEDRQALIYILQSIRKSPENINYLIISLFSLVAIAIDLLILYMTGS